MIDKILKANSMVPKAVAAIIAFDAYNDAKVNAQKSKTKDAIQAFESVLKSKKDSLPQNIYSDLKSKLSSAQAAITRYKDVQKLKDLEGDIKKYIDKVKKY